MDDLLEAAGSNRWLIVTDVSIRRRDLRLRFEVLPAPADGTSGAWTVSCMRVREYSLTDFSGGGVNWWRRDHPCLRQFSSPKASLRIRPTRENAGLVFGALWQAHRSAVDDWIDFDRFLKKRPPSANAAQPWTLAGPEFLLKAYADGLRAVSVTAALKRQRRRLFWSGLGWSERRYDVSLLHFGNSFIVAEKFVADPDR